MMNITCLLHGLPANAEVPTGHVVQRSEFEWTHWIGIDEEAKIPLRLTGVMLFDN